MEKMKIHLFRRFYSRRFGVDKNESRSVEIKVTSIPAVVSRIRDSEKA